MLLARPAAVRVVRTRTQERAVDAVLRMEHRQMLMDDDLQARSIRTAQQIDHLLNVQVVGRGHAAEPGIQKQRGRLMVGDIQREVADQFRTGFRWMLGEIAHKPVDRSCIANQYASGFRFRMFLK